MHIEKEIKLSCRVLAPQEWSNDQRGNFFEEIAGKLLRKQRYKIIERVRFTGMEIDLIADHLDTNERAFVECKFLSDPFSANVIDLLIGKVIRRNVRIAYLFSTSNPGKEAKGVLDELSAQNNTANTPKLAFIGPDTIVDMLIDVYNLPSLQSIFETKNVFTSACLFLYPNLPPFWVIEEHREGIPFRAVVIPAKGDQTLSKEPIKRIFFEYKLYQGLDLHVQNKMASSDYPAEPGPESVETVSQVAEAESLDDYRPCRPEYFIGRYNTQKEIWQFLNKVRKGDTTTRLLALTAQSGFGKSSLIIKLASRFRNQKWKNKFYLYPVDSRSAKGPLFVAKALKAGFESAINSRFVKISQSAVNIDSTEGMLKSNTIQKILNELKRTKRVLVIFFDQFEELFTKDELFSTFESFKKLAFEANAEQSNLVIGFSWRTGITLSDDNPAYHVWHELSDHRISINLGEFESGESSQMVGQFEKALKQKMINPLRRRLLEQGRGMPWLLKKLCIHLYHEIKKGVSQDELVIKRLNVSALFDADTVPLTAHQNNCLKYIARNSPADILDVLDKFDQDTVNRLYNRRLIIRAGQRYAVYWDIFRDFLVEGVVPIIPWTYVPQVALPIIIRSFLLINKHGPLNLEQLASELEYTPKTVNNLIGDLQGFLLVEKNSDDKFAVKDELVNANLETLAEYLFTQLKEHVILHSLLKMIKPGQKAGIDDFKDIIKTSYSLTTLKAQTIEVYANRFLPYLRFAGAIEHNGDILVRPTGKGKEFGKIDIPSRRGRGGGDHGAIFLGASGPEKAIKLAKRLKLNGKLSKETVVQEGFRNSANDLIALNVAIWKDKSLFPTDILSDNSIDKIHSIIGNRAKSTNFLSTALSTFQTTEKPSASKIGSYISNKLERGWSDGSKKRYGGAAKRWIAYFGMKS
ncbi:MAG: YraN family protein [Desulfobacterales bacterium]|nr:YraN family protein [Desulfobacterales bacterium]